MPHFAILDLGLTAKVIEGIESLEPQGGDKRAKLNVSTEHWARYNG